MPDWATMSLERAGVILLDCVHATPKAVTDGYPYIAIPQMKGGRIDFTTARRISREDFEEWTKKTRPQKYDVVLSRRTNPGITATFGEECNFALGQNLVLLRADGRYVLPEFLRWLVSGPSWWQQIDKFNNVGAIFDSLRCADVPCFELPIPPKREQAKIAALLGALDDKIELNRRMNGTLEAMARAIFKDWFVDFGPTRAKQEARSAGGTTGKAENQGRAPYLSPEIWSFFPDHLDDEDKPEGWTRGRLLDHAKLISGGTPKTDIADYWGGPISWASAKDASQCSDLFLVDTERTITQRGLDESATRIVPARSTVVVARGATTGRYCILGRDMAMNQTCYALHSNENRPFWLNAAFSNLVETLVHAAHGSVFDTITTSTIDGARLILGDERLRDSFETLVSPMFERMLTNVEESQTLAALRDLLLPKLMSGEIRVKDAEKAVGEAL